MAGTVVLSGRLPPGSSKACWERYSLALPPSTTAAEKAVTEGAVSVEKKLIRIVLVPKIKNGFEFRDRPLLLHTDTDVARVLLAEARQLPLLLLYIDVSKLPFFHEAYWKEETCNET